MKLSVLISVYNEQEFIEEAVSSLFDFEGILEVIVVDDFSTDNTYDKLVSFQKNNNFAIKIFSNSIKGKNNAFNLAYSKTGSAKFIFKKTLARLFGLGFFAFFILYWVVEDLFALVFGEEWRIAGSYAQILIPLFFIIFFVSPLTLMNMVFEKNKTEMYWQFGLLILNLILVFIANYIDLSFEEYLHMMVLVIAPYYLLMLYIVAQYNKK